MEALKKYKIGVLAGGVSSERDISLKSGKAVYGALEKLGLDTAFLDVDDKNFDKKITESRIDFAFIALHGRFGEDGAVQEKLEGLGIPYTGSPPQASRNALDKVTTKEILKNSGILVAEYEAIKSPKNIKTLNIKPPCVVKPRREGSSIGVTVVLSDREMGKAVKNAFTFDDEIIIERFIDGREITVGILEEKALPVVEIVPAGGTYDFHSKYTSGETKYIVPAKIDEAVYSKARGNALGAHIALGCRGFSRVDMIIAKDNNIFVLEVNTIPGLTERSLLPLAAKAGGLDFSALCVKMILTALNGSSR